MIQDYKLGKVLARFITDGVPPDFDGFHLPVYLGKI